MADGLAPNVHFQLRLVKRFDGKKIITYGDGAKPKEHGAKDQTLDFYEDEKSVLHLARNYCSRGEKRKGPLPGEFLGVVVVRHESEPSAWEVANSMTLHHARRALGIRGALANRPSRVKDSTVWRFYVDPDGKAYTVNPKTHEVYGPVM